MKANSSEDTAGEVSGAATVLRRVADLLDQVVDDGGLDRLGADDRVALAGLAAASAEAAQATREIYRRMTGGQPGYDGAQHVREELAQRLPLNRKERFYTGTVLPMLIAGDGFAHVDRFLRLCGLSDVIVKSHRDGSAPCQLLSEYGFAESLLGADDDRWDHRVRRKDTPDNVLVGGDWLVAVEAKMFDRPTAAELDVQLQAQTVLVREWAKVLKIPADRVFHVALLPARLASEVGALTVPVLTWEQIADAYRIVGPAYWVGILDVAAERWVQLVSKSRVFGLNAETMLTGLKIVELSDAGLLGYGQMGRSGGFTGGRLSADVSTGGWRTHSYEVRGEALPGNPNWFSIPAFVELVKAGQPAPT